MPRWILLLSHSWVLDRAVRASDRAAADSLVSDILKVVNELEDCWLVTDEKIVIAVYKKEARILDCDVPFFVGDRVTVADGRYSGTVRGIGYHFEHDAPTYYLDVCGKPKSRRFLSEELVQSKQVEA